MAGARDYNPPPPFFSSPSPFKHQIQESAAVKAYDAEWKWMNSSEAKQRSAAAKAQALSDFKKRFPHAQMSRFEVQVEFDANRKALGRVLFPDGDGSWENPLIEDQKYWSPALKAALGAQQDGGFPAQLSLLQQNKPPPQPVPAIAFSDTTGQRIADLFNKQVKIYVTPTDYFITKFRQIFTKTQIKFTQAKYARKWLAKPDMSFLSNPSSQRLAGDSGATTNNTIAFIRNDQGADTQFEHFVPAQTSGLTLNGLGRINQSIMAFGYCILGAQANTRSSILGNLGTARNTQTDFLVLIEDSIKTLNVSNGPVKYQDAIQATKVRLNLAVARGVLLLPSRMIINTESIVGYNNNLQRATDDMKLGVNNQVNQGTKKASLKLMAGGPSKVNPPNSHPSNPIHKQATEAQGIAKPTKHPTQPAIPTPKPVTVSTPAPKPETVDTHHVNKSVVAVGALVVAGLLIYAAS